jgi:hypothetical protein
VAAAREIILGTARGLLPSGFEEETDMPTHNHDRDRTTLDYVQPGAEEHGRLREDFDFNDLNKDGRLTLGEFIRYMQSLDENMSADEIQIGFDMIDTNRDGAIEFEEFLAWWTQR